MPRQENFHDQGKSCLLPAQIGKWGPLPWEKFVCGATWLRKGKYILRATVWFHCAEVNLAKTCLHVAIFVDYSSPSKHQVTEDNREGNQLWGQRKQNSMKRIHSPVHSHKPAHFRLTCPFQVDPWSELQLGHTKHGTLELQGALEII